MPLEIYRPPKPLSDYVAMFWYWEDYTPPHAKERILPIGTMEITIDLSEQPLTLYAKNQSQAFNSPIVAGIRSEFFIVDTSRPTSILSVLFKPGGALQFFGVPAHELQNLHLSLDTLWGRNHLYEQLLEAPNTQARFCILENALMSKLYYANPQHKAVNFALHMLNQTQSIAQIVDQIALSPTRFIQVFRQEIGLTPKVYSRIQRFQTALKQIVHAKTIDWVDIALTSGYYDQAHFINEFQAFSGITPTQYAPQDREHINNLPYTG